MPVRDQNKYDTVRNLWHEGMPVEAIAYVVNMSASGIRNIVRELGLPLRQPRTKHLLPGSYDAVSTLANIGQMCRQTAAKCLTQARKIDSGEVEVSYVALRKMGLPGSKIIKITHYLKPYGINLTVFPRAKLTRQDGAVCWLTYFELLFLAQGAMGVQFLADRIKLGWEKVLTGDK